MRAQTKREVEDKKGTNLLNFVGDFIGRFGKKKQENLESRDRSSSNVVRSKSANGK